MASKSQRLLNMLESAKNKSEYSLSLLVINAEKVLKRIHYDDRKIKVEKVTPLVGMKSIRFDGTALGSKSIYPVSVTFYDIEFSDTKDFSHSMAIDVPKKDSPTFASVPLLDKTPVKVFCGCTWFRFACEWYLSLHGALAPLRKPRTYTKVAGSNRPPINPLHLPCVCKHIYQFANDLKGRGLVK